MKIGHRLAGVGLMVSILGCTFPAWAGEWIQGENGQWVYEENQELLKGWNRIDGIWYCLDTETGVWIEKPSMTSEVACRLLENKLLEMGMYRDEEEPLQFKVDYENTQMVQVSVGYEDKPDVFHRINTYEIDKKKGTADPVVGDKEFSLW